MERLAEARGIKLRRQGSDLLGLCPFHPDRTPSLVITPGKNLWHCLGACGTGGTAIDWVMRAEGVSFRHAVELLRKDHLPLAAGPVAAVKQSTVRKLPAPVTAEAGDGELLGTIVGFYQDALRESPEAMRVPRIARPAKLGTRREVPAGLRQPDAGLPAGSEEPCGRSGGPRPSSGAGHLPRERP